MTTNELTEAVAIEQCDRDAAADLLDEVSSLLDHVGIGQVADLIRDGEYDEHEATLAFARHRTAAIAAVRAHDAAQGYRLVKPTPDAWCSDELPCARFSAVAEAGDMLAEAVEPFADAWNKDEYLAEAHWSDFKNAAQALADWRKAKDNSNG